MFAKRRITKHVYNKIPKGLVDLNRSEFYQPSMVDDFIFQKVKTPGSERESVTITSDITMLFNQKRLDRMTSEALIQHFESMAVRNSSMAKLRSKLSDDQLCSIVKSRYIQTPSELLAYSNYLVSAYVDNLAQIALASQPAGSGDPASGSGDSASGSGDSAPTE